MRASRAHCRRRLSIFLVRLTCLFCLRTVVVALVLPIRGGVSFVEERRDLIVLQDSFDRLSAFQDRYKRPGVLKPIRAQYFVYRASQLWPHRTGLAGRYPNSRCVAFNEEVNLAAAYDSLAVIFVEDERRVNCDGWLYINSPKRRLVIQDGISKFVTHKASNCR